MHKRTGLSAGNLNGSDHLKVELIEPTGKPPFVAINWPTTTTITSHLRPGGGYCDAATPRGERPAGSD
jgi:hypothetical protein